MNPRPSQFTGALICALLICGLFQGKAQAVVDDAHSFALEAADPWVRQNVSVRYEYARGTIRPNTSAKVGHQVFRGNEYWLFAGGSEDGVVMNIKVTDSEGNEVSGELSHGYNSATFRFTPERTMMVVVEVSGEVRDSVVQTMDWALVYGYRSARAAPEEDAGEVAPVDPADAVEEEEAGEAEEAEVAGEAADAESSTDDEEPGELAVEEDSDL